MRLGFRWRISNGKSVIIRKDKWLLTQHASRIISLQRNFPNNTRVCALTDEENSYWLENHVRSEFSPHEASTILSLPLNHGGSADKLIWSATKNGIYSTKTAYQLLIAKAGKAKSGPSNRNAHKTFWQQVWSLNVPSKILHFIWCACTDSLSTKQNLFKGLSIPNALCERCGSEVEDSAHALWGCQLLKEIWWEIMACRGFLSERFANFRDWFHCILLLKESNLPETMAYIAWCIWFNRNAARVGSPSLPLSQIHRDALERFNEFETATLPPLHTTVESHPTHWLPPPPLQLKSNCDGAIFHGLNCAGLGIVIQNSEGSVIAALSERVPLPPSVDDLEAMAWRRSVTFAIETGF